MLKGFETIRPDRANCGQYRKLRKVAVNTLSVGNDVVNTMRALILGLLEDGNNSHHVVKSLTQSGHDVDVVDTFTKAMDVFKQPHNIDLIISDVHLENGGNVFDFLRWLKKNPATREIPFVMFSCQPTTMAKYLEDGVRASARTLGAAMYITMDTFDSDEFRKQIDSLLPAQAQLVKPASKEIE